MKLNYIPNPKSNKTKKLAIAFFIVGLLIFLVGGLKVIPFRSIIQAVSIIPFAAAIILCSRYLLKAYSYRIEDMGEGPELFVDEVTRSSYYTVCRLELKKLLKISSLSQYKAEDGSKRRYDYRPDIFDKNAFVLEFSDGTYDASAEKIRVVLSPNEEMLEILKGILKANGEAEG